MRWKLVRWITITATNLSHILIRKRQQDYTFEAYGKMPKKSLGYQLYQCLTQNKIAFKPNLVRHDLKHVLLGYKMALPDEMRIHAFLLGNRSYNLLGIAYLALCACILPETVKHLKVDFKRGRHAVCLKKTLLKNWVKKDLNLCRKELNILPLSPWKSPLTVIHSTL